ncbi:OmpA family protein [Filomicrobium sp.]|uniref:OmpA family protein n=1 Tax=Filomicrobium sp. TaxID=2024831 RepID=UPI00258BE460|nr:OmpA family protein [Filomicrobium sp.]MCV0370552.1 OmpA family protein [Filomicrobium sp.]
MLRNVAAIGFICLSAGPLAAEAAPHHNATPSQNVIERALANLLNTRAAWNENSGQQDAIIVVDTRNELDDYLARRDAWNASAQSSEPTDLKEYLARRDSWGASPEAVPMDNASVLAEYLAKRESWGPGPEPKRIAAPLAAGASRTLPRLATAPVTNSGSPVIHAAEERPVPHLTEVPQLRIRKALRELLATREAWGSEPALGHAVFAGDLKAYLKRRDSWGEGPKPKPIRVKLAAGAPSRLRIEKISPQVKAARPIIHHADEQRPPELTDIPASQTNGALEKLLAERASWGSKPVVAEARVAGDLGAYLARRDRWGVGPEPKKIRVKLAAGAKRRLPVIPSRSVDTSGPAPIIHPAEDRPAPVLTAIPVNEVKTSLTTLLSERASYGTEPTLSVAREATDLDRFLARRTAWGEGSEPKKVRVKLAAGANRRLPKITALPEAGPVTPPIIHPADERPAPVLAQLDSNTVNAALTDLLNDRASWGSSPSITSSEADVSLPVVTLDAYLARRARWNMLAHTQVAAISLARNVRSDALTCTEALRQITEASSIQFATGSAKLTSESNRDLKQLVTTARECAGLRIRIEGHTDSLGDAAMNQALSEARAQSVAEFLTEAGLNAEALETAGLGESRPLVPNTSRANRALNRRIEFKVLTN